MSNRHPIVPSKMQCATLIALFLALACPGFLSSQDSQTHDERKDPRKSYALIVGTVWGPDDRPVYGVKVKIRRADQKKPKWELFSNHTGEFAQRLPAGKADYVVAADTKGLKSLTGKKLLPGTEVTVHFESEERVDIGLHLKE
jgi:hypothetical protein